MRRRDFLALVGGAAAAVPFGAYAQAPMPVIGFLNTTSRQRVGPLLAAFHRALSNAGFVEGRNLAIEYRWAEDNYGRLPELATELIRRNVAVIAATGGLVAAQAAKAATRTVPVLFIAGDDPIKTGLVASYPRPGGNATGVMVYTADLGRKRLELLLELLKLPSGHYKIAMLVNPGAISTGTEITDIEAAMREFETAGLKAEPKLDIKLELLVQKARTPGELDTAIGEAAKQGAKALLVSADSFFTSRHPLIVKLAAEHKLPASYPWPQYARAGGLMSYGTPLTWAFNQIGTYAAQILKGAKPEDLPVQLPEKYEMIINLGTAKSLGISVSPFLIARADTVIE